MAVTEFQKNVSFSQGMLEKWLEMLKAPPQILEALQTLVEGISFYKNELYSEQQKTLDAGTKVLNSSTQITELLATIQHQLDQIAELEQQLHIEQERATALENNLGRERSDIRRRVNSGRFVEV